MTYLTKNGAAILCLAEIQLSNVVPSLKRCRLKTLTNSAHAYKRFRRILVLARKTFILSSNAVILSPLGLKLTVSTLSPSPRPWFEAGKEIDDTVNE